MIFLQKSKCNRKNLAISFKDIILYYTGIKYNIDTNYKQYIDTKHFLIQRIAVQFKNN